MFKYLKKTALATGLIVSTFALQAQGATYIIEPDSFDFTPSAQMCATGSETGCHGTLLTTQGHSPAYTSVFKALPTYGGLASTGIYVFQDGPGSGSQDWDLLDIFVANFSLANVISVSIDVTAGYAPPGQATLHAYDSGGNELDFMQSVPLGESDSSPLMQTLTVSSGTAISYIEVDVQNPYVYFDHLVFETAEADSPAALSLLALGLMGMGYGAYRRKKA
jgi:hypothetical protein